MKRKIKPQAQVCQKDKRRVIQDAEGMRGRGQDDGKRGMEVGFTSGVEHYVTGQTQAGGQERWKEGK